MACGLGLLLSFGSKYFFFPSTRASSNIEQQSRPIYRFSQWNLDKFISPRAQRHLWQNLCFYEKLSLSLFNLQALLATHLHCQTIATTSFQNIDHPMLHKWSWLQSNMAIKVKVDYQKLKIEQLKVEVNLLACCLVDYQGLFIFGLEFCLWIDSIVSKYLKCLGHCMFWNSPLF